MPESINDWLQFSLSAASEAHHGSGARSEVGRKIAASAAYIANMPPLSSLDNVRGYIACVAMGVGQGYIDSGEAKLMVFMAQTALSAHSRRLRPTVSLTSRAVKS